MNNTKRLFLIWTLIGATFFGSASLVQADAWWGEGFRPPNWVLQNGGTIIRYNIVGGKGADKKYKARMTRDGQYVEVEFGRSGTFDDAKNGSYDIVFYKCKDCEGQKVDHKQKIRDRDKVFASIRMSASSGKNCVITANADTGTVAQSCSDGKPVVPQKTKYELAMEAASENVGKITTMSFHENDRIHQFLTPFLEKENTFHLPYYTRTNLLKPHAANADDGEAEVNTEE